MYSNFAVSRSLPDLFPNMHIQVPMRIGYITGFKGLRSFFDSHIDPESYKYPDAVRLGMAFSPGTSGKWPISLC
jgi:hypothetical protein